jgi:hypothetical protein
LLRTEQLASSGTLRLGDAAYAVSGLSWMDHEYSTSGLGPQLVGAFQFWGNLKTAATETYVALVTSILSLSKDAILGQKRLFSRPVTLRQALGVSSVERSA